MPRASRLQVIAARGAPLSPAHSPLFRLLDRNADDQLDPQEIKQSVSRIRRLDANGDGVVQPVERRRHRSSTGNMSSYRASQPRLGKRLTEQTDWEILLYNLEDIYTGGDRSTADTLPDRHAFFDRLDPDNHGLSIEQMARMLEIPADLTFRLHFTGGDGVASYEPPTLVQVTQDEENLAQRGQLLTKLGQSLLEVRCVDPWGRMAARAQADGQLNTAQPPQQWTVRIDVLDDPLSAFLGANHGGNISVRDMVFLPEALQELDRDGDHHIAVSEVPEGLSLLIERSVPSGSPLPDDRRNGEPLPPVVDTSLPSWYRSMDVNRDGDLSRDEFLGNPEQFASLDADEDGFITANELP